MRPVNFENGYFSPPPGVNSLGWKQDPTLAACTTELIPTALQASAAELQD